MIISGEVLIVIAIICLVFAMIDFNNRKTED